MGLYNIYDLMANSIAIDKSAIECGPDGPGMVCTPP